MHSWKSEHKVSILPSIPGEFFGPPPPQKIMLTGYYAERGI